jgi:WD40 repeat protein
LGLIDQEIARLPEKYRLPLVLCDLEERTQPEAARLLGWTLGSFRGRLLRGREQLRARLARRGIAPAVLAAVCVQGTADAAALTAGITRLAVRFSNSPALTEISPSVAALVREGTHGLMLAKLKLVLAVLLAASTLVAGAGLMAWPILDPQPAEERAEDKRPSVPESAEPQLRRDRAGDPLPAEALCRLGTIRLRPGGGVTELAFGPDGKTLVSCGRERLRFWDAATGAEVRRFQEELRVRNIAVSPDGTLLAMRVYANDPKDDFVAIHEFATGQLLHHFRDGEARFLNHFLFSPDGKVLAASSRQEGILELWDLANGRPLHTLKHKAACRPAAFSADGKILLSYTDDTIHSNTIHFWDVAVGKELRQIKHDKRICEIALSPDGKLLASIDCIHTGWWHGDSRVRLWDAASGRQLRQLAVSVKGPASKSPGMFFWKMALAPDGKTLLTGGTDGVLRVWDTATGRELRQIPGFCAMVSTFAFAPDGKKLAVVDGDITICVFDFASGTERVPSHGHRGHVASISITPDGQTVVTSDNYKVLRFWELATGRELQSRAVTGSFLQRTFPSQLQPDGRTYLTFEENRTCRLRNLADGQELAGLRGHELRFPTALSPDGKTLAARIADGKVGLIDPATGVARQTLHPPKVKESPFKRSVAPEQKALLQEARNERSVSGMAFTSDGRTLVIWNADSIVTVWNVASGKKRRQFTGPTEQQTGTAALSPDGKLLAFGFQNSAPHPGILHVLDATTGKEARRFTTATYTASQVAFSPDGKSLAWSSGDDGTVYLGEIATGRERRRFAGHTALISSLAFSADGKMLLSGSADTTALVWDLTGRLTMEKKFGAALSAEEMETHWKALAAEDAAAGYRAVQALAADPIRSVPYLRTRLHPVAPVDEKRLQQWIADLDSDQSAIREKATTELEKLGAAALPAMQKALDEKPTLEMRRRLEQLTEKQEREAWSRSGEGLRIWRTLEVLERAGTPEARDVLRILANGAPGAWQTIESKSALERLAQRPTGKR